jgi:uncharacterized membrane protein
VVSDTALTRPPVSSLQNRLAAVRRRIGLGRSEADVALRVVCAGVAAYAALFVFAAVVHYAVFEEFRFDLGNMVQALSNTLHGHVLETTTLNGAQHSRLGFHVDPFLLVLLPLFWVWSSPLLLLVVQVLAVASGALPVFWLARKHLGSARAGAHFAFAYLLYPATQFNAFTASGVHAVSFAVPLVLYAIWFLDEDRLVSFSVVALLAGMTKEEISVAVGCLGIWYAVRTGRRLFGLSIFAVGFGITLFDFLWVIPHYSPTGADPYAWRYHAVGGTPAGIAHKLISDPSAFVHAVATGHKALYLALLLGPFLALSLLEPLLLLGAVPDLAINLLSGDLHQTNVLFQYTAGIVPFVVAATIFGAARFRRHGLGLSLAALGATAAVAFYSPILVLGSDVPALGSTAVSAKTHAVALIPDGESVSVSNRLGSHLSARRYVYMFPTVGRARWIIADRRDPIQQKVRFERALRAYESDKAWRIVFSSNGVVVLHERSRPGT